MNKLRESDILLLEAFSRALSREKLNWPCMPERKIWSQIYRDAQKHKIFPMVMETISRSDFFANDSAIRKEYRFFLKKSEAAICTQAQRSADFLLLYDYLLQRDLKPQVMKGIVCRSIYSEPEHRPSGDEDLLVDSQDFPAYHQAMLDYGMVLADPAEDIEKAHEVAYRNNETLLYIEVHKCPFPPESEIFGDWNRCFDRSEKSCFQISVYGCTLYTLDPTSHLLYLILHAFKHFLHGGSGIRQIADIVLFSEAYADQIKWDFLEQRLCEVHAKDYVRAAYKIAVRYLREDLPSDKLFPGWDFSEIDELPLLQDVMEGGVYGTSSLTRQHSSNITLYAMQEQSTGRKSQRSAILHAVFLPKKSLEKRYPYLRKAPFLLPVAWTQRVMHYLKESKQYRGKNAGNDYATKSIQLGQQRIKLMKQYNIIKE